MKQKDKELKVLFDDDLGSYESFKQFHKESWKCHLGEDEPVALTIVATATNMYEATGEEEYKDYPIVPELGIINKEFHSSIADHLDVPEDCSVDINDINGYYGFACYVLEQFLSTDELNDNILGDLKIEDACLKSYKCRFTGEEKKYPAFKTHEACLEFLTALVKKYADTHMTMIGFILDRPVNLVGETGWRLIETLHTGNAV